MRLLSVLISTCLLAVAAVSAGLIKRQAEPDLGCKDAFNNTGTCGAFNDCAEFSWMTENGRELDGNNIDYLTKSLCRTTSRQFFVCCPSFSHTTSVDNHRNGWLLNRGQSCGTYIGSRIREGEEVPLGKHPWMALLFYTDTITGVEQPGCGGALISLRHVLTAAHCVTKLDTDTRLTSVRLGEHSLELEEDCQLQTDNTTVCNSPQSFAIRSVVEHEGYNEPNDRDNDIALIKLDRDVIEDRFVGKICLPFGIVAQRDYTGVNMTVAGFGKLGPNRSSPASDVLMEVTLPGISQEDCRVIIARHGGTIGEGQICAGGEGNADSCAGDSGGPLVVTTPHGPPYSLIGIVSFGARRCGEGDIPSVNTRVSEYLDWILDRLD